MDYDDLLQAAYERGIDFDERDHPELGQVIDPGGDYVGDDFGTWVQSQGDIPASETPGSGWPQAVPIRPANWDLSTDPDSYKVAWGDTYAGLAATYLGTPMRWREIWDQQPDTYRYSHSPDVLYPGEWLFMPPDATATLLASIGEPVPAGTTPAPAPPGGYPTPVGGGAPKGTASSGKKSIVPWVVGGGALAALAAYALS